MRLFYVAGIFCLLPLLLPPPSSAQSQITSFSISDPPWTASLNQTLLSPNSTFAAAFLPIPNSPTNYTFSLYYHNITPITVIWSANQNFPVNRSTPLLITASGQLRLGEILFTSIPSNQPNDTKLVLTDDGSLVFGNWTSSAHPTNTILPNQNINGTTLSTKNGKFAFVDGKQLVFNGDYDNSSYYSNDNAFVILDNDGRVSQLNGASFICSDLGESKLRRLTMDEDGNLRIYSFNGSSGGWTVVWQAIFEMCRVKGRCGENSICVNDGYNSTVCQCPPGFRPVSGGAEVGCEYPNVRDAGSISCN